MDHTTGDPQACTLQVRVTPRARHTSVRVAGGMVRIKVAEVPVDGRATEAARVALARALRLRPSAVTLERGLSSRTKRFRVDGLTSLDALTRLDA